jgi:hypothetical protein
MKLERLTFVRESGERETALATGWLIIDNIGG